MTRFAPLLILVLAFAAGEASAQSFTGTPPTYPPLLPRISLGGSGARHSGHRHHHAAAHRHRHKPAPMAQAMPGGATPSPTLEFAAART
jgi:hypothetical protein